MAQDNALAHAHRDRRRRRAVRHHVEMRVEGRNLVDLGERKPHLARKRGEMRRGEVADAVLQQVEMLDQQVAAARPVAEQRPHLFERRADRPAGPSVFSAACAPAAGSSFMVIVAVLTAR